MARYYNDIFVNDELAHFGISGMKWGVRRYQNADGSLTSAGVSRYRKIANRYAKAKSKSEKYANKSNKHTLKSGNFLSALGTPGYYTHHARKASRFARKSEKQSVKAYRQKKKMEKLMKATNMSLAEAYKSVETDPVTMERIKAMFA